MIRAILGGKKKRGHEDEEFHEHQKHEGHGGEPPADDESNWLVSYADMMTLLCGFFIMLFSMSKMDEPRFEKVKEAMAEQFGGEYHSPQRDLAKWVTQILQDTPLKGEADVETEDGAVAIVFRSAVFFETLSAEITDPGKRLLSELATTLKERQKFEKKNFRFMVEGHTDSRPILSGAFATNWELSAARAARVVRVFLDQGYEPKRMAALGYSDTRPLVDSRRADGSWDEEALSKNRRVVVKIFHDDDFEAERAPAAETTPAPSAPSSTPSPTVTPLSVSSH